jgi:hypothetical protein
MFLNIRVGVFLVCILSATVAFADEADVEIRQMLDYLAEEWNAGDLNSVRGRFHRDFVLFTAEGSRDREQRINELELIMAEGQDHGVLSYSNIEVKKIGNDHALVYGKSRLKFDDGTEIDNAFSSVYLNTPFGWKLVYTHE